MLGMRCDEDHGRWLRHRGDGLGKGDAVNSRHANVEQHHIKRAQLQGIHGLLRIGRFGTDYRPRCHAVSQQGGEPVPGQRFIVNQQHPEFHAGISSRT